MSEFYDELAQNLQRQESLIVLDAAKRPSAYATWREDGDLVTISRQSAPFGDHVSLLKQLKGRFEGRRVISVHNRSSRKEQAAW